jgi:hypothetical protein
MAPKDFQYVLMYLKVFKVRFTHIVGFTCFSINIIIIIIIIIIINFVISYFLKSFVLVNEIQGLSVFIPHQRLYLYIKIIN